MICPYCNGRGESICYVETYRDENTTIEEKRKGICRACNGSGKKPQTNGDVCNIVELIAEEKEGTMPVRAKAMMYTNPRMLQYTFVSQLGNFVRKLSNDEFLPILDTIEDALHILIVDRRSETPAQTPAPAPEPVMVTDPVAEVEARIYKQLYNDLLEKVLKHG